MADVGNILFAETDYWSDTLFGLDPNQRFVLLIVAIGCFTGIICAVVGILTACITTISRRRLEAELKREMLDRGMSADEVVKVVEAQAPDPTAQQFSAIFGCRRK